MRAGLDRVRLQPSVISQALAGRAEQRQRSNRQRAEQQHWAGIRIEVLGVAADVRRQIEDKCAAQAIAFSSSATNARVSAK